jgi:hypothetical protein
VRKHSVYAAGSVHGPGHEDTNEADVLREMNAFLSRLP